METVDDHGWNGVLKRATYKYLFNRYLYRIEGVLASGHATPEWIERRGVPASRIYPFAYFLPESGQEEDFDFDPCLPYRFLFVGQFIPRKRLDFLISVLAELDERDFELRIVGAGPKEEVYREYAEEKLGKRLVWIGRLSPDEVRTEMRKSDCLVLPSRHDGWGAVVSESMMAGTPAVVSDRCGSASVVKASGRGRVFTTDDRKDLAAKLKEMLAEGRIMPENRRGLANWARCLGADSGADYLLQILDHRVRGREKPVPPWGKE